MRLTHTIRLLIVGQLLLLYQNLLLTLPQLLAPMESSTSSVMIQAMALLLVHPTLTIQVPTPGTKSLACLSTLAHGVSKVLTLRPPVLTARSMRLVQAGP